MKKYYFEYLADCGSVAMDCFMIVEGNSLGNAYINMGGAMLFYGENLSSDEEALKRIKSGIQSSIHFGFLIPDNLQKLTLEELKQHFNKNDSSISEAFKFSGEKVLNPSMPSEIRKKLNLVPWPFSLINVFRKHERAFRWRGVFEK